MDLFGPPNVKKLEEKRKVKKLIKILSHKDHLVRYSAVEALGFIKDTRAVEPLIKVLNNDEDEGVRQHAISALGWIGDTEVLEPLIVILKRHKNEYFRVDAVKALGEIGDGRAVEPLIAALKDESKDVREEAAEALGKIGNERAIKPLIVSLKDKSKDVRKNAVWALKKFFLCEERVKPLMAALKDESKDVREEAAEALGKIGDKRAVKSLLSALKDKSKDVREKAAWALGEIRDERDVEPLIRYYEEDGEFRAKEALEKIGTTKAVKSIQRYKGAVKQEVRKRLLKEMLIRRAMVLQKIKKVGFDVSICFICEKLLNNFGKDWFRGGHDKKYIAFADNDTFEKADDVLFEGSICFNCKEIHCLQCLRDFGTPLGKCPICRNKTVPCFDTYKIKLYESLLAEM